MTMRTGTCTSCGAQYGNIPPTVTASKVRCRKCSGEVVIPPLEAAAPAEPAAPAAPASGLQAKPIGDVQPKGNGERPASATPVDRKVARPEKPKAPAPPPKPAPPKPPAPKGGVKPPLPKKPVAAKPPPPKPAAPKPPVAKPAPPKPAAPAPAPEAAVPAPQPATKPAPAAPKKDEAKAADLMAKLKAKKAAEAPSEPASSTKGADVLAKLKAKKAAHAEPAAPQAAATGAGVPPRKWAAKGRAVPERKTAAKPVPKKHTAAPKRNPEDGQHRHEHHHTKKKPPIVLTLVSVIALGVIGFGLKWFLDQGEAGTTPTTEETAQAPAGTQPAAAQPAATQPAAAQPESAPAAGTSEPAADQPAAAAGPEPAASEPAPAEPTEKPAPAELGEDPEWSPPEPGMEIEWRGYVHGDSFRLTAVPLLEKWSQTSDEDWAGYVEDAELFWADEGASSMRAASRLVDGGRHAYPAMVNVMLNTDWDDPYSIGLCHSLNNRIVEIGKGTNLGWKTVDQLEPGTREWHDAIFFNKRVVIYWYNFWISKFANSDEEWDAFANKHQEKAAESKPAGGGNSGGVDFDD